MSIEIRSIRRPKGFNKPCLRDFLDVVDLIYRDDPNFVRSLDMDVRGRLDQKENPFYDHGEADAWVAYRDGKAVGRISASIDRLHLERYGDETGFFGFFDTIDDQEVANALVERACAWLRERDMKHVRGPMSLSINEECGLLIDGFDTPPMMMMAHHRAYQGGLAEGAGFAKCKDLFAWRYAVGQVPPRAQRAYEAIQKMPEVTTRGIDLSRIEEDVRLIMDVFNDAWSENWGYVPATEREMQKMAKDFKLIAMPEITKLTFIDGEIAAVALALPNVNELIHDTGGKLFPTGALKLLWRLKVRGPRSVRLIILGIRKKWRNTRRYAGLSAALYVDMNHSSHLLGIRDAELSWTLEDNGKINVGIKMMGGEVYKTYRLYEKSL